MKHLKCDTELRLDLTEMYKLNSPGITVTPKGISPGVIQIDPSGKKSCILFCPNCEDSFSTKEELERNIRQTCNVCEKEYPPSQIYVTDPIPCVCQNCIDSVDKISSSSNVSGNKRLLAYYGSFLKNGNHVTLLTVLLKKN